jgi:hypothetical protein
VSTSLIHHHTQAPAQVTEATIEEEVEGADSSLVPSSTKLVQSSSLDILISWFHLAVASPSTIDPQVTTSTSIRSEMILNGITLLSTLLQQIKGGEERTELGDKIRESLNNIKQSQTMVNKNIAEASWRVLNSI